MKANHNAPDEDKEALMVVSNGSKILKWKQITTCIIKYAWGKKLFLMVQRY